MSHLKLASDHEPHMVKALEDALALARSGELKDLIVAYTCNNGVTTTDKVFDRRTSDIERLGLAAVIDFDVRRLIGR